MYIGDIGLLNICVMSSCKEMVDYGSWFGKVTVSYYSLCPTTIVHIGKMCKDSSVYGFLDFLAPI